MCSRVRQSADPFVVRNLIEKLDALPSQELLVFQESPTGEIVDGYLRWGSSPATRIATQNSATHSCGLDALSDVVSGAVPAAYRKSLSAKPFAPAIGRFFS
jgi:hypothetical protein